MRVMISRAGSGARGLERASIAGAIVLFGAAFPLVACTDGTTPDCSAPEAGCGPDFTESTTDDGAAPIEAATTDAAKEAETSTPVSDGGASTDADASHD